MTEEKRFVKDHSYLVNYGKYCILDKVQHKHLYLDEVCEKLNEQQITISALKEENEELKQRIALFEQQEDEFEQYTAQTIENMIANYRDD